MQSTERAQFKLKSLSFTKQPPFNSTFSIVAACKRRTNQKARAKAKEDEQEEPRKIKRKEYNGKLNLRHDVFGWTLNVHLSNGLDWFYSPVSLSSVPVVVATIHVEQQRHHFWHSRLVGSFLCLPSNQRRLRVNGDALRLWFSISLEHSDSDDTNSNTILFKKKNSTKWDTIQTTNRKVIFWGKKEKSILSA